MREKMGIGMAWQGWMGTWTAREDEVRHAPRIRTTLKGKQCGQCAFQWSALRIGSCDVERGASN